MNYKTKIYFSLAVLACLFLAANALAQGTLATLEGVITDDQGAVLPGAKVELKNVDTGYAYSAISRADGSFILSGIEAGRYDIQIVMTGFNPLSRKGITFNVGSRIRLDFKLATEALKEEVTVQAEAPIVEVTKSEISSVVGRKEIDDLPMITRSFAELALTKPGVGGSGRDIRAGAQPSGSSEVLVDGVSNEFGYYNTMRSDLPADAIQEFRVLVNQFGAEYGNATAMVLHAITRSGTNEYRGRAYAFTRNEAFDAKNYFARDLPKEDYTQNRFGGFFGGPIIKDKLHFFLSYEGARHKTYSVITSPLVPSETVPVKTNNNQVLFKLSYQLNEKNMFSFRYTLDYPIVRNGGVGGYQTKDRAYDQNQHDNVFEGTWVLYTSQNSMNEFRIQYSNRYYETIGNDLSASPDSYQINRPSGYFGKYWGNPMYWPEKRFQFLDNFSLFLGKHNLKTGFDFNYVDSKVTSYWGYPGIFSFRTDEPFDPTNEATYPYRFRWNAAAPSTEWYRLTGIAGYVQDKWQVLPTLTLNIGLRYSHYTFGQNPNQERFVTENKYNWDPRIGFSWDPMGDGKTSIRGGVGKYTNSPMGNIIYASVVSRIEYDERIINYPGYPDPFQPNPFRPGGELKFPKENYTFTQGPSPMSMQYTLGVQREILTDFSASVDFVISQGRHLYWFVNKNPIIPGTGDVRPNPDMGNWMDVQAGGHSNYKGMYVTLTKRYAHGWQFELNYTLSKGEADVESGDWNEPSNNEKRYLDYGPVNDDARHRLNITGIVDLPLGFQLSGILYYRSALPYTIITGNDDNLDGIWNDFPDDLHRNAGRNNDTDYFSLDARLSYLARIVSSVSIQFFAEVFNLTNRVNFGSPEGNMQSSDFGKPVDASDPRLIQLGFRVNF